MSRPFEFDLTTIPPADMHALTAWLMENFRSYTPFVVWLIDVLGTEAERRIAGASAIQVPYIHLPQWDDAALAIALEGSTALGFGRGVDEHSTGRFIDLITIHVAAMAANRLRSRAPVERN